MTYCLAIKVNDGLVFASDSRTNAGVDYVNTYGKMHVFHRTEDRILVLLSAGNLATTQAVMNAIQRDLDNPDSKANLDHFEYMFDAAQYVGEISRRVQKKHGESMEQSSINIGSTFILGGQIKGRAPNIYLIYPEGNYITACEETPYLQIGETKYGKPILDRIINPKTNLNDAARCALVSLDSTMRSNISVGPPLELAIYKADSMQIDHHLVLREGTAFHQRFQKRWSEGLKRAFVNLPRFDWEDKPAAKKPIN
jgi:putative proteasome-type protease